MYEQIFKKGEFIRTLPQMIEYVNDLDDSDYKITIKKMNKRSLDANGYCWALLGKLSAKLKIPKTEIYQQLIREIGGNYKVVCVQDEAVETLINGWEHNGIGWICETMPSKIEGCTNVLLYEGSSEYDTKQMSRLIDLVIEECKTQGIETLPRDKIDLLNK